jgi:hypothetical protein
MLGRSDERHCPSARIATIDTLVAEEKRPRNHGRSLHQLRGRFGRNAILRTIPLHIDKVAIAERMVRDREYQSKSINI